MICKQSLTVCSLFLLVGCQARTTQEPETPPKPPTAVEALRVTKGIVNKRLRAAGVASGIREAYVVSETQGTVRSVHFELGQEVQEGRVLVQVDDGLQQVAAEQARTAVAAAELNLRVTQKLFDEGDASQAELTGAQSQASGARTQLESAQRAAENCRITAPISGYIAQKQETLQKGNFLAAGVLVARIVDLSALKAMVSVGEMEVGILQTGMEAAIELPAIPDVVFEGTVAAIAAGSDPSTGSYAVEVQWENTPGQRVKSGMSVSVRILTRDPEAIILAPGKAVIEREGKKAVFVAADQRAVVRFVETDRVFADRVEITRGLDVGDVLITSGVTTLKRGEPIAVTVTGRSGGLP